MDQETINEKLTTGRVTLLSAIRESLDLHHGTSVGELLGLIERALTDSNQGRLVRTSRYGLTNGLSFGFTNASPHHQ